MTWRLVPESNIEGYNLTWKNEDQLLEFEYADVAGWYYIMISDGYHEDMTVEIEEPTDSAVIERIYWADNNNADGGRP